jgi:hypothetical protein
VLLNDAAHQNDRMVATRQPEFDALPAVCRRIRMPTDSQYRFPHETMHIRVEKLELVLPVLSVAGDSEGQLGMMATVAEVRTAVGVEHAAEDAQHQTEGQIARRPEHGHLKRLEGSQRGRTQAPMCLCFERGPIALAVVFEGEAKE